jgi:hypothetical protein
MPPSATVMVLQNLQLRVTWRLEKNWELYFKRILGLSVTLQLQIVWPTTAASRHNLQWWVN